MASQTKLPAPGPEYNGNGSRNHVVIGVVLRVLLFAASLVCTIVMVTSKQTKMIPVAPGVAIPLAAKFSQSPALLYFVVANSVACLYSIITGLLSVLVLIKPKLSSTKHLFHFVIFDSLLLSVMASATGAAGAIAYIGLKGNSHTRWNKVCNVYGSFCAHIGGSVVVSLLPSVTLLLLVWLSVSMLSKNTARR